MTATLTFEQIKQKQHKTWSSGDYGKIAWLTVPLADALCDAVDLRSGSTVLDVATGTGHVAMAAARRFCDVTGIDYVPELVEIAQQRAAAEGLDITFRQADAENLPYQDGAFDYVLSAIGVMFTADHQRAADELARVCRAGGRIGVASWTPTGFIGQMLKTVARHAAPPPGALPPPRWGSEDVVRELFGDRIDSLTCTTHVVTQRFRSPEHFAEHFLTYYGPTYMAAQTLDAERQREFRADLAALATSYNKATDGTVVCDWEYLIAVATRA